MVAWLALFVALGGVASGLPGRNSVDSGDIVNERVRAKDIRGGGVRSSELRDGAVHEADIAGGAVATAQLADGAVTPVKLGPVPAVRVDTPQEAPGCSSQAIASSSTEVVQFSFELYDTQNLHPPPTP